MARRVVLVVLWVSIVGLLSYSQERRHGPRRPVPPLTEPDARHLARQGQRPLPGPSPRDPILKIVDRDPGAEVYSGTAFAIDDRGHWLTAHHVVSGCGQMAILTAPRNAVRITEVVAHPQADVVVLANGPSAPALLLGSRTLFEGQDGFHFGYPRGEPGDVHGELIGRVNVRGPRSVEPGLLWAEVEREPSNDLPLGGLSGGPVVNPGGAVIGIAIGSSPRRGRVASAAPESVEAVLTQAGLDVHQTEPEGPGKLNVAGSNYAAFGDKLRRRRSVAKMLCWDRQTPPRRRSIR
jgi:S1-C subfamily serine protease